MKDGESLKIRLDLALVQRNLAKTRSQALDLIKRSQVELNGRIMNKQSIKVSNEDKIELLTKDVFVGRGALKLNKALETFKISSKDRICLDIGASTGGFTQSLLLNGAKKVYAIDVGSDQLADEIKNNSRVINLEKTNILEIESFDDEVSLVVMDLSFISVCKVLPYLFEKVKHCEFIVLYKPQFEVGKSQIGKNGIVSIENGEKSLDEFKVLLESFKLIPKMIRSPIKGKRGNLEYLVYFEI